MRNPFAVAAFFAFSLAQFGCDRSNNAELAKVRAEANAAREEAVAAKAELARLHAGGNAARGSVDIGNVVAGPKMHFDEKDMLKPISHFQEYPIHDFAKLPNCLDVLRECVPVRFDGKTEEQYKSDISKAAETPCRVVLRIVDISADYDFAEFEILQDSGESGLDVLKQAGDLGDYTHHLKGRFPINNVKAKGLDSKNRSIGDRVVLVGLGYVGNAASWGAAHARKGVPRGDNRHVMIRAFGKPNTFHPREYEFAFMVRNWYFASQ